MIQRLSGLLCEATSSGLKVCDMVATWYERKISLMIDEWMDDGGRAARGKDEGLGREQWHTSNSRVDYRSRWMTFTCSELEAS